MCEEGETFAMLNYDGMSCDSDEFYWLSSIESADDCQTAVLAANAFLTSAQLFRSNQRLHRGGLGH